ncbi:hypothetical protein AOLI_G00288050 [Acnodon oligacanthus]
MGASEYDLVLDWVEVRAQCRPVTRHNLPACHGSGTGGAEAIAKMPSRRSTLFIPARLCSISQPELQVQLPCVITLGSCSSERSSG